METKNKDKTSLGRRGFLAVLGLGAGAAGAVALTGGTGEAKAESKSDDRRVAGYRETEHVRRFYESARF